jgi:plastocyanin
MLRRSWKALPVAVLAVLFMQSSALAATVSIQASNSGTSYFFSPQTARVPQGSTAQWTNTGTVSHTSTSDTSMPISWDSGTLPVGSMFSFTFSAAGKYSYHCNFHQGLGMIGTISVPVKASPSSGPAGTVFTITVATANATGTFVYDIQKKVPGGSFQNWKTGITAKSASFDSTGLATGTYQFRARLRDTATAKMTLYSAGKSISVT